MDSTGQAGGPQRLGRGMLLDSHFMRHAQFSGLVWDNDG